MVVDFINENVKGIHSNRLLDAINIERETAEKANAIGFIHRALALCSLPYKDLKDQTEYQKKNGFYKLTIVGRKEYGLPYGNLARLLHIFIASETVKTQSREIILGNSLTDFLNKLGLQSTGGKTGSITRLNNQIQKLFYSSIHLEIDQTIDAKIIHKGHKIDISNDLLVMWDSKRPSQGFLWGSYLKLTEEYYNDVIKYNVPIDLRAVRYLKQSSMALDIYFWLSHRLFYLEKKTKIPFELLALQFGTESKKLYHFKSNFIKNLLKVTDVWRDLKVTTDKHNLILMPINKNKLTVPPKIITK